MSGRVVKNFLRAVGSELARYPLQYAVGAFFLWGALISLLAVNLEHPLLTALYLLAAHVVVVIGVSAGFVKNANGKRNAIAAAFGLVALLLMVVLDVFLVLMS